MAQLVDLVGKRFDRLLVLERKGSVCNHARWRCRCDCGGEALVTTSHLNRGHTRSCGCVRKEIASRQGKASATHGMTGTPLYKIWVGIKTRCSNPRVQEFKNYGGRGIMMCARWRDSFEAFVEDMGPRPTSKHSIERVDNDGNYEPDNCIWLEKRLQGRNTRRTMWLEFRGRRLRLSEWANEVGLRPRTLYQRLERGWSLKKALTTPTIQTGRWA